MASGLPNAHGGSGKAKRTHGATPENELNRARACIDVERGGDWMPAEELCAAALAAVEAGNDLTINLDRIEHLDASALQILLALDAEQKKRGRGLELADASPHLRQWFDYAGAADQFSMAERKSNE
jgi:anti-anti-sigma regulatory factor